MVMAIMNLMVCLILLNVVGCSPLGTESALSTVHILTLECIEPNDDDVPNEDDDEVWIQVKKDGGDWERLWPAPNQPPVVMKRGQAEDINKKVSFRRTCQIELWDHDESSSNDRLGREIVRPTPKGKRTVDMDEAGAEYNLDIEVLD